MDTTTKRSRCETESPEARERRLVAARAYHAKHRGEQRVFMRGYHEKNREKLLAKQAVYRAENQEKIRAYHVASRPKIRDYVRHRWNTNPQVRLAGSLRNRIYVAVQGIADKAASTKDLLGCTIPELRGHLEKQFRPGMTWENYGPVWHVDHIKPCAKFDLMDPEQQRECFNFKNLQPLFAEENFRKGAR